MKLKKIKALVDMPGIKAGESHFYGLDSLLFRLGDMAIEVDKIPEMIKDGFIEIVEEESLSSIIDDIFKRNHDAYPSSRLWRKSVKNQIIREFSAHENKRYTKIVDEVINDCEPDNGFFNLCCKMRLSIEKAGEEKR